MNPRTILQRHRPLDFVAIATGNTIHALCKHYRAAYPTIQRWVDETGAKIVQDKRVHSLPFNFAGLCAKHTVTEIARIQDVDRKVVARWVAQTGITPIAYDRDGKNHHEKRKATPRPDTRNKARAPKQVKNLSQLGAPTKFHHQDNRIKTIFDHAADVIRAERWAVFRCREAGGYDEKGEFWRIGNAVYTPDELLQRADRYRARVAA